MVKIPAKFLSIANDLKNRITDFEISGSLTSLPNFKYDPKSPVTPKVTRRGFDPSDKAPFYDSDFGRLTKIYSGYDFASEFAHGILYGEVHPLTKSDYYGFSEATTNTRDLTFKISRVP